MVITIANKTRNLVNWAKHKLKPYNITKAYFPPASDKLNKPLLITCQPGFDQNLQIAGILMRVGFANGWSEACGPAKLVPISDLMKEIDKWDTPSILMTSYDFDHLSNSESIRLRAYDVFIWVGVHPNKLPQYQKHTLIPENDIKIIENTRRKIILSEPKFVWQSTCSEKMHWYQGWRDDGLKWVTMHPAVDSQRYYPEQNDAVFGCIKMAYVGGYWQEKAQAFDMYLRPWEDILTPFGYQTWPYKNYGGKLDANQERQLYSTAGLIPLVTSPAGWDIGEITERYLKAPACKAFCIADENPALGDIFNSDEILQAQNAEHFHSIVNDYLNDKIDTVYWARKGYDAVIQRHTYYHRALQIYNAINSFNG